MRFIPASPVRALRRLLCALFFGAASGGAGADEVAFDLHIERGRVPASMRVVRVKQGDVVRIRWTSDRPTTLHLHGYDIETKVGDGAATEMSFTASATGRFSVEEHVPSGRGQSHGAVIVRIEVHPR